MDQPAALPSAQHWRTAALAAATVATVELFILVVIGIAFAAKPLASEVERAVETKAAQTAPAAKRPPPSPPPVPKRAVAKLPRSETSVIVLNGNGVRGAAGREAERVRRLDYLIAGTANAPRSDFVRSMVMFRRGFKGEAVRLARDLGVKRVAPLDGLRAADLQGAHLAFIVGG